MRKLDWKALGVELDEPWPTPIRFIVRASEPAWQAMLGAQRWLGISDCDVEEFFPDIISEAREFAAFMEESDAQAT